MTAGTFHNYNIILMYTWENTGPITEIILAAAHVGVYVTLILTHYEFI